MMMEMVRHVLALAVLVLESVKRHPTLVLLVVLIKTVSMQILIHLLVSNDSVVTPALQVLAVKSSQISTRMAIAVAILIHQNAIVPIPVMLESVSQIISKLELAVDQR